MPGGDGRGLGGAGWVGFIALSEYSIGSWTD
jgi:hypothetical protein